MEIKKENISAVTTKFLVTIPAVEIQKKMDQWFVRKAPSIKIPGFRPGKVPLDVIQKRYSDEAEKESLQSIVQETLSQTLEKEKIKPIIHPYYHIDEYKKDEKFVFSLFVDEAPNIALKDFKELKIEKIVCEITDQDVEKAYDDFYKNYKKYLPVDKTVEINDLVRVDLETLSGNKLAQTLSGQNIPIQITASQKNEFIEVISSHLLNKKAGDTFSIKYQLSKHFQNKELAGKKLTINVKIVEVDALSNTEFNNDEAVALGYKDLTAFKAALKENITEGRTKSINLYHKRHVLDALAEVYHFDVPQSLVEDDFKNVWRYVSQELTEARRNNDEEVKDKTDEEIAKEYLDVSNRRVRLGFVIDKIASEYKITLTKEQVQNAIFAEVSKYPDQQQELLKFYNKNPQAINRLLTPLLEDLVIEKVMELATVNEIKISEEELQERLKEILP